METDKLKELVGRECLVVDPRSKKKQFEPATINGVSWNYDQIYNDGSCREWTGYTVTLHRLTTTKRNRYGETYEYNRSFDVSGDRIKISTNDLR